MVGTISVCVDSVCPFVPFVPFVPPFVPFVPSSPSSPVCVDSVYPFVPSSPLVPFVPPGGAFGGAVRAGWKRGGTWTASRRKRKWPPMNADKRG
jgi:hypothetical protein